MPLDVGSLRKIAAQISAEVPPASTGQVGELRGGLFTMSPDGRFVAGPLPDVPGLWVAAGCNGSGFSSALGLGEALAAWMAGRPHDIEELSPARFGPVTDEALVEAGKLLLSQTQETASAARAGRGGRTGAGGAVRGGRAMAVAIP